MQNSSRYHAKNWPYTRHETYEELLRKSNTEWFVSKGYQVNKRLPYLLASWEDWPKNIICPDVSLYIQEEQKRRSEINERFPLHKYIHHGLSSQAMLFNLVGPLIINNDLSPLKHAFSCNSIHWPLGEVNPQFEVEDKNIFNEDTGQPTSIDLALLGKENSRPLYIEAKLVEREFGSCSVFTGGDCDGRNPVGNLKRCYLDHIGRLYWPLMKKYGFLHGPAGASPICPLAMYYQFFREVIFAIESGGDFVLLYDQRNPSFFCGGSIDERGLMPFLSSFVPEEIKPRIHSISIQQIIEAYKEVGVFDWITEFEKKYALSSQPFSDKE